MSTARKGWSREELLVTFRLYCRTPFGRLHSRNPSIIELAQLIGRTPGAVTMKACNFASLDPHQQARNISALGNVSRADRELWEAFLDDSETIAEEAEAVFLSLAGNPHEALSAPREDIDSTAPKPPEGATELRSLVKTRRVQSFFREAVLASYGSCCALTGIAVSELLNASHIVPWSVDRTRRADPRNGICLNALHDRAFDRGLITFDTDLRAVLSPQLREAAQNPLHRAAFEWLEGRRLTVPMRFQPSDDALAYHRTHVFKE